MIKLILLIVLLSGLGCSESSFELSEDSRLPIWFDIPEGGKRENYITTMDYYITSEGRIAVLKIKKKKGFLSVKKIVASQKGLEPITFGVKTPVGLLDYPMYEVLTVEGVSDVVEHRSRESVFYFNDDPDVWKSLGLKR